eukprot:gene11938-14100_t
MGKDAVAASRRVDTVAGHMHAGGSISPNLERRIFQEPTNSRSDAAAFEKEAQNMPKSEVRKLRSSLFCKAQSVSYENTNPLMIVGGSKQYLWDEAGTKYLDTRNNVATLNTNSRYLHPNLTLLAKKLTATLPAELRVCFFVNSGSEANDLALRLAFTHTRNSDVVVVDRAYHGHTKAVIEISPYKYEHEGGPGKANHIHKVGCPDTFRGPHTSADPAAGTKYAAQVRDACAAAEGGKVAAFFVESGMSVAGVIIPPEGYLAECFKHVRAAGGVCVADEVQTGFGRFGTHYWGFQQQGVVPDIVTMGKPFGNGMPLAAVVCSQAVAESFHNGLEYFNTFGGNPVCAAAGLAVLEVVEEEQLQASSH